MARRESIFQNFQVYYETQILTSQGFKAMQNSKNVLSDCKHCVANERNVGVVFPKSGKATFSHRSNHVDFKRRTKSENNKVNEHILLLNALLP